MTDDVNDRLQEQLLGYALGALDESEQRELEERLAQDPALRQQLEAVQQSLEPLAECWEDFDPPAGLVERTCDYVAAEASRLNRVIPGQLCGLPACAPEAADSRSRWRLLDWTVMGGICLAAAAIFFPAVVNSQFLARMNSCQNNLREIGMSLAHFAEIPGRGYFPAVPRSGPQACAGIYRPTLVDQRFLTDERVAVCPGSYYREELLARSAPTLEELDRATGLQLRELQRLAGGTYAYVLGIQVNGELRPVLSRHRAHFAILADSPVEPFGLPTHGRGRNLLFEDLQIRFVSSLQDAGLVDDPFVNRYGDLEAGCDDNDAVLGPSSIPPLRTPPDNPRVISIDSR